MFTPSKTIKNMAFIFGAITLSLGLGYAVLAVWQEPLLTPPDGNIDAPLNAGSAGQEKKGGLLLNTSGAPNGLIVDKGNVGIGTTNPGEKLDVAGGIKATGDICTDLNGGKCLSTIAGGGGSPWLTNGTSIYYNGGNVGIGTSAPTGASDVIYSNISNSAIGITSSVNWGWITDHITPTTVNNLSDGVLLSPGNSCTNGYNGGGANIGLVFNSPKTINKIRFFSLHNIWGAYGLGATGGIENFKLERYNGGTWTKIPITGWSDNALANHEDEGKAASSDGWNTVTFLPVTDTQFRIVALGFWVWSTGPNVPCISEIETWGNVEYAHPGLEVNGNVKISNNTLASSYSNKSHTAVDLTTTGNVSTLNALSGLTDGILEPPTPYGGTPANGYGVPSAIGLTFNSLKSINKIRFYSLFMNFGGSGGRPKNFKIERYDSGAWTKVPITGWSDNTSAYNTNEGRASNVDGWHTVTFSPVTGTQFRIYIFDSWINPKWNISEIEMWGNGESVNSEISLEVSGGIKLSSGIQPICDASKKGVLWFTEGGAGKDVLTACAKDNAGVYAWRILY